MTPHEFSLIAWDLHPMIIYKGLEYPVLEYDLHECTVRLYDGIESFWVTYNEIEIVNEK